MEAEPIKSDPPKRKRRWFQFRLRTLLIGVTLFCVVVGSYTAQQAKIVRERMALLDSIKASGGGEWMDAYINNVRQDTPAPPWLRRILGDKTVGLLLVPPRD